MAVAYGKPDTDNRDVIVIGGSAGGVEAVTKLARGLPADLPAAVLVAIHRGLDGGRLGNRGCQQLGQESRGRWRRFPASGAFGWFTARHRGR